MPIKVKQSFQYDIFLSHSEKDKDVVLQLVDRLQRDGLTLWVYEREIRPGSIPSQIEAGLNASRSLLLTTSKHGEGSKWMKLERDVFLYRDPSNEKGHIIPVRLDRTQPSAILQHFRYYDWIKKSRQEYSDITELLKEQAINKSPAPDHASIARVYDHFLGGTYNTVADRTVASDMQRKYRDLKMVIRANRAFLRRSVSYLAQQGVNQFLDIGSGLPTQGNTHEIAQAICPSARVVYVDCDRQVVELSRRVTKDEPNVRVVLGDVESPRSLLSAEGMRILDFRKPVGLLLVAVMHFVLDDGIARKSVRTLRESLAIGSYLVISHAHRPKELGLAAKPAGKIYQEKVAMIKQRSRKELLELFEGTTLVEPGIVFAPQWHPEIRDRYLVASRLHFSDEPYRSLLLVGVGVIVCRG